MAWGSRPAHQVFDIHEPVEDLLVGEAMKGARQAVQAGTVAVVWVRERAAHQVGRVRAHVAALCRSTTEELGSIFPTSEMWPGIRSASAAWLQHM